MPAIYKGEHVICAILNKGYMLGPVSNIQTHSSHEKVYVKWTDPEDYVSNGSVLASWSGTLLVRKEGSCPKSRHDGEIVLDSKVRNAYQDQYFCDDGLTDGVTYYYKLFPYSSSFVYTDCKECEFDSTQSTVNPVTIYGVSWDGSSTTKWSRTDTSANFDDPTPAVNNGNGSSPFDKLQPWSGMTRVTDSVAGELVAIPKFWYKWTKDGNALKLQIADGETDGFYVSPAHADRGDGNGERDVVYVGRYHCATGTYKSETNKAQACNIARSTARSSIHNLGSNIWQFDYAMRMTIQMLYLVEFADWNSQAKIGYGCFASNSEKNNGKTDAMAYHTGTTAANLTTYGYTQYRNIEGLWDNVYDWMDGCYYNRNGMYIINTPSAFSDSYGGSLIGKPSSGCPSNISVSTVSGFEWAIYPVAAKGSDNTYIPDTWVYLDSYTSLCCGGGVSQSQANGLFCVSCANGKDPGTGCRLQKLP